MRVTGGEAGGTWRWFGTAAVDPAMLFPQGRKGMSSYVAALLRFTIINCRKRLHSFVTSANNSWQLKMLNNCLRTCSSLWKEIQEERVREHPLLWKDKQSVGDIMECVFWSENPINKEVIEFFPLESSTVNPVPISQELD